MLQYLQICGEAKHSTPLCGTHAKAQQKVVLLAIVASRQPTLSQPAAGHSRVGAAQLSDNLASTDCNCMQWEQDRLRKLQLQLLSSRQTSVQTCVIHRPSSPALLLE